MARYDNKSSSRDRDSVGESLDPHLIARLLSENINDNNGFNSLSEEEIEQAIRETERKILDLTSINAETGKRNTPKPGEMESLQRYLLFLKQLRASSDQPHLWGRDWWQRNKPSK